MPARRSSNPRRRARTHAPVRRTLWAILTLVPFASVIATPTPAASAASAASAQSARVARVTAERENFRREPAGRKVATVLRGAELRVLSTRDRWVQVELSGWLPADAVARERRGGFDWIVTRNGGAQLLREPAGGSGPIAELAEGFGFERQEERGAWVRIRREGWIWAPSVEVVAASAAAPRAAADSDPGVLHVGPTAAAVHDRPDGDTVATLAPGASGQVLGRTGDWYRVRVEGWVYGPAASDSAVRVADTGDLSPAQLRAEPARYRGALVRWRVQVVALRRAEPVRTDFKEGEPFLLARGPGGDRGFVYLAVPPHLLSSAESVAPLSYVTVVGRVRTGRSDLMGSPVIDLTDIETETASR